MAGFFSVLFMSALLGIASFGVGVLPLSFAFSKSSLAKLSAFGSGLLVGAALGVIIPEGIETLASGYESSQVPTIAIALSLLTGFSFMLVVEQLLSPHSHVGPPSRLVSSTPHVSQPSSTEATVEFDVELGELERTEGIAATDPRASANVLPQTQDAVGRTRAFPLTLGLVMHALADGLALGSSALSNPNADPSIPVSALPSGLSLVVFFTLVIHKAPTALALTTSLLTTSLPRPDCKRHIAVFSASTPVGALVSYSLLSFFGTSGGGHWPGVALLISGGTFLYVATVLRPVSGHGATEDIDDKLRILLTVWGMFVPLAVGGLVGHDHEHGV